MVNNHVDMNCRQIPFCDDKTSSLIKANDIRIKDIRNNINEFNKKPYFYRNKQMIAVAVAIAAVVATAIIWGIAVPIFIGAGYASSSVFAAADAFSVLAAGGGIGGAIKLYKSYNRDKNTLVGLENTLVELETENKRLIDKIQTDNEIVSKKLIDLIQLSNNEKGKTNLNDNGLVNKYLLALYSELNPRTLL